MKLIYYFFVLLGVVVRLYSLLPGPSRPPQKNHLQGRKAVVLAIFLGSGGHTAEALALVDALDFSRYSRRIYIVSEGDTLSASKAQELETRKSGDPNRYEIVTIPRARRVHQSFLTTPFSALRSLWASLDLFTLSLLSYSRRTYPDVLLLNGPGTCFVLCLAIYINKFLGLPNPRTIYVETFARVQHLSLSGKLLRPLVDRFIVQWPALAQDGGRGEYKGWLC